MAVRPAYRLTDPAAGAERRGDDALVHACRAAARPRRAQRLPSGAAGGRDLRAGSRRPSPLNLATERLDIARRACSFRWFFVGYLHRTNVLLISVAQVNHTHIPNPPSPLFWNAQKTDVLSCDGLRRCRTEMVTLHYGEL